MSSLTGILIVALSAASFGTLAIFYRYAGAYGMDPLSILCLRFNLSAALMLAILALRREKLPRGGVLLRLAGMGAAGYVGQSFAFITALRYASPGLVALLLYLYPVFVAVLSAIWLRERITNGKALALGLAVLGLALTAGPAGGQWPGVLLALTAAAIYSVYIVVGARVMRQVTAVQSSAVIFTAAGLTFAALAAGKGFHLPPTAGGWAVIGAIVLVATVLPVVTFLAGLERIGPTNAAMLSTLEPVVTVLLAALLFKEIPGPVTMLGGGLILAAVLLLAQGELRRKKVPPDHPTPIPGVGGTTGRGGDRVIPRTGVSR